jgi:hypothetical protein
MNSASGSGKVRLEPRARNAKRSWRLRGVISSFVFRCRRNYVVVSAVESARLIRMMSMMEEDRCLVVVHCRRVIQRLVIRRRVAGVKFVRDSLDFQEFRSWFI